MLNCRTNIVLIERSGDVLFQKENKKEKTHSTDRSCLNMENIYEFSNTVDILDVKETIEKISEVYEELKDARLLINIK